MTATGKCFECEATTGFFCTVRNQWYCEEHKPQTKHAKEMTDEELASGKWTKLNRAGRRKIAKQQRKLEQKKRGY